ncbi:methyltransferase family protein [Luteimonas cucumeris]|uniref:Methyltransferase family protein n=1 Tax=Luteimonas cucumeris TaxID=985012 RepID=A0A562L749_9GAMM|nr:methyltransferase domain-containing protein [Luteimonas cucumeris]TWI03458.1 methyltransferase family protein [Luteimonas cucumeris]
MPVRSASRQPDGARSWFMTPQGQALLRSEEGPLRQGLGERPGLPALLLAPHIPDIGQNNGVFIRLKQVNGIFDGDVRCATILPIASEAVGTVILQHVAETCAAWPELLEECVRVLVPGGRLWIFALNPLGLYRARWSGNGLRSCEPVTWRRRLRAQGLQPEPVSVGLGPRWRIQPVPDPQTGAGSRAAYLLRAEKQVIPLTRIRQPALRWQPGLPAA